MNHTIKHHLTIADCLTTARMAGTAALAFLRPLSPAFFFVYALTGLTDVLDGWIARRTGTASDFGARLDSAADILFYGVVLWRIFPILYERMPPQIRSSPKVRRSRLTGTYGKSRPASIPPIRPPTR